ncbi:MAG: isoprenylcysteine carboxylmethyltransferase family protein [Anaerolineales bacterium]|nr:isoprenylcysteine carboxylmethyltransferase family protein [Anaerolineales bacterium]
MLIPLLFTLCLILEGATTLSLTFSRAHPEHRIWPPLAGARQRWVMPFLFFATALCIISLGLLDWGGRPLPRCLVAAGIVVWLSGNCLAVRAWAALGLNKTMGMRGMLTTHGPYRWSRNPQYAGFMLALAGWGVMTSSCCTLIAAFSAWIPLLLVPRVEEPWLEEVYGYAYRTYCASAPRWLPRKNP